MFIDIEVQERVQALLLDKYGDEHNVRIERGVAQAAGLWTEGDGGPDEFESFCLKYFIGSGKRFEETFDKLDNVFEALDGHYNGMLLTLREPLDLDLGPLTPTDKLLGQYDPSAHLTDDLYKNKLAFVILLNFPHYSIDEKKVLGQMWSDREWAIARMGDHFVSRVPASLKQRQARIDAEASAYVYEYNIYMGNLRDRNNNQLFPDDLRLISHWGIRDELKSHYGKDDGLTRQTIIYNLMNRIITQEIPEVVVNNPDAIWNLYDNSVIVKGKPAESAPEPNTRYKHILNVFNMMREEDAYYPAFPTYIRRKFDLSRELAENEVEGLFTELLSSPQLKETAGLIKRRLGRDLEPFDIWYDGFKARSGMDENVLNSKVLEKYPGIDAFQHDIKNILMALEFSNEQASFLASRIVVDASRGPGHAWGAKMKSGISHLRTRSSGEGMDYKGYSIALHELGHNVEQTFSLQKVDYHMMQGVPIAGCTEAFAFIFQHRDLELLGIDTDDKNAEHLNTLDNFWGTAEIMAVSLVDMKIWNWLYEHPDSTPEALKKAAMDISRDIWNRFYADALGHKDIILLGIYSHMINYPLYLADYPLGHIIQFQIEHFIKGKNLGEEMERICSTGSVLPQVWMNEAVGSDISVKPMLEATGEALAIIG